MVNFTSKQIKHILSMTEGFPLNIDIKYAQMDDYDSNIMKILNKSQQNLFNLNKKKGVGCSLNLLSHQVDKIRDYLYQRNIINTVVNGGKLGVINDQQILEEGKEFYNNSTVTLLAKEIYHQLSLPVIKALRNKYKKSYGGDIEFIIKTELARHPQIHHNLDKLENIKDMSRFVKSIITGGDMMKGIKKGRGVLSSVFSGLKKIVLKTAEVVVNIAVNTAKNVWDEITHKYVQNPLNIFLFMGRLIEGVISGGVVGALAVVSEELGQIIGRSFLKAIKTEISTQLPEGFAKGANLILTAFENVNNIKNVIKKADELLKGDIIDKIDDENVRGVVDIGKNITSKASEILGGGYKVNKELKNKLDKILI